MVHIFCAFIKWWPGGADILNYNGMAKLFLSSFVLKMIPLIEELFSKEVNLKFIQVDDGMRVKIPFHKKREKNIPAKVIPTPC